MTDNNSNGAEKTAVYCEIEVEGRVRAALLHRDVGLTVADMAAVLGVSAPEIEAACVRLIKKNVLTTGTDIEEQRTYLLIGHARDERALTIKRRAKIASLLDGAGIVGTSISDLVHDARRVSAEITTELALADVNALIAMRYAELRAPGDENRPVLYLCTLLGTRMAESSTWHDIAEKSLAHELPRGDASPADNTTWSDVAKASEEKASAESATNGKKGRKKSARDASPQLAFGSAPGRFTQDLPCALPENELVDLRREHLELCDERDAIKEKKSAAMKAFTAEIEDLDERELVARKALQAAEAGKSTRPVECEQRLDGSTMRIYRLDTGEMIEERAATAAELEATNPAPAATPTPEGAEVREAEGSASPSNEAQNGVDKSSNGAAPKKRGRKPKSAEAATAN